jgi:hypothetical protein
VRLLGGIVVVWGLGLMEMALDRGGQICFGWILVTWGLCRGYR